MAVFFNDNAGIYTLQITGSLLIGFSEYTQGGDNALPAGTNTIISWPTGSYKAAFFNYVVSSGSSTRAGQIVATWYGTSSLYSETTTIDMGSTTDISMKPTLTSTDIVLNAIIEAGSWDVKSSVNLV